MKKLRPWDCRDSSNLDQLENHYYFCIHCGADLNKDGCLYNDHPKPSHTKSELPVHKKGLNHDRN